MIRLCFLIGEDMQNRSGRFHLFTHWDVGVFLHWTTAFMITMLSLLSLAADGWQESLGIVLFFCVIYGSVVAHEFGHVRAAQSYGISVRDIVIYPIGGVATLNSRPETAMSSLHVSLAGPLVSILLALLTPLIYAAVGTLSPETLPWFEQAWIGSETVLGWMVMITHFNLIMAAFNLLPVYPLDGGQALHAVVWQIVNRRTAYQLAHRGATIGGMIIGAVAIYQMQPLMFVTGGFITIFGTRHARACLEHDAQAQARNAEPAN